MILKIVLCALVCPIAIAQDVAHPVSASAEYDLVSTVKRNHAGDSRLRIRMDSDAISIEDASVRDLLANTYGLRDSLIFNLPKWAEDDHFDIQAKVLSDDADFVKHMTRAQRGKIFKRLLGERFGVVSHTETRTMAIYELVRIGPGPQLVDDPPPAPGAKQESGKPGGNGRGNTSVTGTRLEATGVRIGDLCANLARILDRALVDKTGLTSFYDITLAWSDEQSSSTPASEAGESLFTALREQLGLKLVPGKGPVEVLVVDKVSRPQEN